MSGSSNQFTVTITDDTEQNGFRYGIASTMATPQPGREVFSMYPNPASSLLYVSLQNTIDEGIIMLADMSGKQLLSKSVYGAKSGIDISSLPAGVYFARVMTKSGTATQRLVKL